MAMTEQMRTQRRMWRMRAYAVQIAGPGAIALSRASIAEDASVGTTIGTLSVIGGSGTYTFSITADPDSKFAIVGANLNTNDSLDYETAAEHSVTIQADNGVDDPISGTFTITVTDVSDGGGLSGSPMGLLLTLTYAA